MCQWLCSLCLQSHHLCTQVHLCLAGCESGARWAAQKNSLLRYTGGGGANALGPADQLSCRWRGGQVDLQREDDEDNYTLIYTLIPQFSLNHASQMQKLLKLYYLMLPKHKLISSKANEQQHSQQSWKCCHPKASFMFNST